MLWKTFLDHSLEILTALIGTGILGYLWGRWLNSNQNNRIDEYESQILSLRNRINQQDADSKISLGLQDSWASEKSTYEAKIESLINKLNDFESNYSGYVSPQEFQSLQERLDIDIRLAAQKHDTLLQEKESLVRTVDSMQSEAEKNNQIEQNLVDAQAKLQGYESSILEKTQLINTLEEELDEMKRQLILVSSTATQKEEEIADLRLQLDHKLSDSEATIHSLNQRIDSFESSEPQMLQSDETLQIKENEIADLRQKLTEATDTLSKSENYYKDLLALKENDWNRSMQSMEGELSAKQADLDKIHAQLTQSAETHQSNQLKINEYQSRVHQLEQNLGSSSGETEKLKTTIGEQEKLIGQIQDVEKKLKEWEGRWREASTEAEQFKLAHGEIAKERDQLRQHISLRESELVNAKNELETFNNAQTVQDNDLEQKYNDALIELHTRQEQIGMMQNKIDEISGYHHEWERKWHEANHQVEAISQSLEEARSQSESFQRQIEESTTKLHSSYAVNQEAEHKLTEVSAQLAEKQRQLNESHDEVMRLRGLLSESSEHLDSHRNALTEWEKRYHEEQSRLNQANEKYAALIDNHKSMADTFAGLEALKSGLESKTQQLGHALTQSNEVVHRLESQIAQADAEKNALQAELTDTRSKLNDLQQAKSHLDEMFQSKKDEAAQAEAASHTLQSTLHDLQLRLVEVEKVNSSMTDTINKNEDFQLKYQIEVKAWQKRIYDLEKELVDRESHSTARFNKEATLLNNQIKTLQGELVKAKEAKKSLTVSSSQPTKKSLAIAIDSPVKTPKSAKAFKATIPSKTIDVKAGASILGKKFKLDDHKIVEGIGPKIEVLLKKNKIKSWSQLSDTPIQELKNILDTGDSTFSLAEPTSWPAQAKLASIGEWAALKKLQNKLHASRLKKAAKKAVKVKVNTAPAKSVATKSKSVKTIAKQSTPVKPKAKSKPVARPSKTLDLNKAKEILGLTIKLDDLKLVEGIGPKIEKLLRKEGITTWMLLSQTKAKSIKLILDKAGSRFSLADPKTWPSQSALLAKGQWTRLKTMQNKLKGGRLS